MNEILVKDNHEIGVRIYQPAAVERCKKNGWPPPLALLLLDDCTAGQAC